MIDQVSKTTFLGVIIHQHLTWDDHIPAIKQKQIAKSTRIIFRIRENMQNQVLPSIYNLLIHPYHEYCNIILAINRTTCLHRLFLTQKMVIRIISNPPQNSHFQPIFKKLNILPLDNLNDFQVACFMYRSTHGLLPTYFFVTCSLLITIYMFMILD